MTAPALPSLAQVQRYARGALKAADATDRIPVPIDEVVEAANLQPAQALYLLGDDTPRRIHQILSKLKTTVLGVFDLRERQIYVDNTMNMQRQRFVTGHEAGHGILPWHEGAFMTDDHTTLALSTRHELEQEANAFSAELLFAGDSFSKRADDSAPSLGRPLELANEYEASITAALRRYAERTKHQVALLVFGHFLVTTVRGTELKVFTAQCTQSSSFAERYGLITTLVPSTMAADRDDGIALAARATCGSVYDPSTLVLPDHRRGGRVEFTAEVFSNGYLKFVLLHRKPLFAGPRVRVVPTV